MKRKFNIRGRKIGEATNTQNNDDAGRKLSAYI